MSRDPLQRQQLVRPLAALPPRYRVQDLRIPRACSQQCCRQAPQRRLSHSRRALVAASLAYRRHLVRRVSLVTEEGAIDCAKVHGGPIYEVKLRPAISLAASRRFMHPTWPHLTTRQSHLPRSGYGRAMGRPRHGGGGSSMAGGQGAAGAPCRGDPAHQEASEQNATSSEGAVLGSWGR